MKYFSTETLQTTLSNGLRVICMPTTSPVVYCGYAVNAGTRDEEEQEQGMAHFVEHILFKGTTHRRAWHILNRMEAVGGDLNAYTNKEETVVYASFLSSDLARAVELLTDIVFRSTFPQSEIDKEVEVIIDEIQSYEDTPSELIFDDFEDLLFRGHPLGHNILGRPELLRSFGSADAKSFTDRLYRPDNMVFFIQGRVSFARLVPMLERLMAEVEPMPAFTDTRTRPLDYKPSTTVLERDTHQAHVMIGSRGYDAYDDRRTALYLLNNILGGPGMNSRLNVALRERRGLVYTVESSLTSYTDTGVFCIYFGCDPEDIDTCLRLTYKELKQLRDNRMTASQLHAVKKQLTGQICVASDNFENNALGMGKMFLHYNKFEGIERVCQRVEAITADDLLNVAGEMFDESYLSTLIYK
jgi:predicted Zn-dependent peptidase